MKWFKEIVVLVCTLVVGAAMGYAALAEQRPRMSQLGSESVQNGGADLFVRYLHDSQTEQEVVCISAFVHADGVMSCYPTGRKW